MERIKKIEHFEKLEKIERFNNEKSPNKYNSPTSYRGPTEIDDKLIEDLLKQLKKQWDTFNIEESIRKVYLNIIENLPLRKSFAFISKEIFDLKSKNSLLQVCLKSIFSREESLKMIHEMNEYLLHTQNWDKIHSVGLECAEILHAHRILTLTVAENIEKWKEFMNSESKDVKTDFFFEETDYLEKMKTDLDFLINTEMGKIFKFSNESDPLLITPSKLSENQRIKNTKKFLNKNNDFTIPIPVNIKKRVTDMNDFIKTGFSSRIYLKNQLFNRNSLTPASARKLISSISIMDTADNDTLAKMVLLKIIKTEVFFQCEVCVDLVVFNKLAFDVFLNIFNEVLMGFVNEIAYDFKNEMNENYQKKNQISEIRGINEAKSVENSNKLEYLKNIKKTKNFKKLENLDKIENLEEKSTKNHLKEKISFNSVKTMNRKDLNYLISTENIGLDNKISTVREKNDKSPLFSRSIKPSKFLKEISDKDIHRKTQKIPQISPAIKKIEKNIETNTFKPKSLNKIKVLLLGDSSSSKTPDNFLTKNTIPQNLSIISIEDKEKSSRYFTPLRKRQKTIKFSHEIEKKSKFSDNSPKNILQPLTSGEITALCEIFYKEITNEFIDTDWIENLALNFIGFAYSRRSTIQSLLGEKMEIIEEIEDNVNEIFTPGVHSPNVVLSEKSSISESLKSLSIHSEQNLLIKKDAKKNEKLKFFEINENREEILKTLKKYFFHLPNWILSCFFNPEKTVEDCENGENGSWLWYGNDSGILGCLVYSTDVFENDGYSCIVHHVSVVNFAYFGQIIERSLLFLNSKGFFKISYKFFNTVLADVSEILLKNKLKESLIPNSDFKIYNIIYQNNKKSLQRVRFSSYIFTKLNPAKIPIKNNTKQEMTEIGNRLNLLANLQKIVKKSNFEEFFENYTPSTRLQKDVLELLQIIDSLGNFDYFYINSENSSEENTFKTELSLSFNWKSCCFVNSFNSQNYKFIRFTDVSVCKVEDQIFIYFVPTTIKEVSCFFIVYPHIIKELNSELRGFKTDIFHKVENLLKAANDKVGCDELWVPLFSKKVTWDMLWMHGFQVGQGDNCKFVEQCEEFCEFFMSFPGTPQGLLESKKRLLIDKEFIFGISHKKIYQLIEIPLFVCSVKQDDWITS